MRKLLCFVCLGALALLAAMPAWAAGQAQTKPPVKSQVYVRDGILYAVYHPFDKPVKVVIPAAAPVEGQMVVHRDHRATFRPITMGGEYAFHFQAKDCSEYALLILRAAEKTQISYRVGSGSGTLDLPATARPLRIDWPELRITCVGPYSYSISGSLPLVKVSEETTPDGVQRVETFRYWRQGQEGSFLEGDLVLSISVPPSDQRPKPGERISFTFPFCSGCVTAWLAGSSAVSTGPAPGPSPGSGGFGRFWPLLPAAAVPIVLGWVLPRRTVDVWLVPAESGGLYVRRGRRGPRRVRAVVSFAGSGEGAGREIVLGRGEAQEVQAPEGWQVAELATPGRRNKGTPTRLERG